MVAAIVAARPTMPYDRRIRFDGPLVAWHELRLLAEAARWSDEYRAETARLMVPGDGWVECERGGRRFACDRISPLWLPPAAPYRLRQPLAGQRSTVLVLHRPLPAPTEARPLLAPRAQLALARWSARLRRGSVEALALEEAVLAIVDESLGHGPARPPHRGVERARAFLAADPGGDATLSDIAAAAACSPFHLARAFRHATGLSLHGYRTRLRMSLALRRLGEGEDRLALLAAELGYASHSHFSATFRRWFGTTPAGLRQQLRTNPTAPPAR